MILLIRTFLYTQKDEGNLAYMAVMYVHTSLLIRPLEEKSRPRRGRSAASLWFE